MAEVLWPLKARICASVRSALPLSVLPPWRSPMNFASKSIPAASRILPRDGGNVFLPWEVYFSPSVGTISRDYQSAVSGAASRRPINSGQSAVPSSSDSGISTSSPVLW